VRATDVVRHIDAEAQRIVGVGKAVDAHAGKAAHLEGALALVVSGFSLTGAARMFAVMWLLRFALYIVGSCRRCDYGYGINGVIVNPRLTLAEKAQRIARDWFGVVLAAVWICFMVTLLATAIPGR